MVMQIKTTMNDVAPKDLLESRFVKAYSNYPSKAANAREMLLAGFILRELGVCQALVDLEQSGKLTGMDQAQKAETVASLIAGRAFNLPEPSKQQEGEDQKQLGNWLNVSR